MKRAVRTGLLLLVTLALLLPTCAMAADSGSIQTKLAYKGKAISGARLSVYQVGERQTKNGFPTFVSISPFTSAVTTFDGLTSHQSQTLAKTLARVVTNQRVTGFAATTNANGIAKWSGLDYGVYLVCQTGATGTAAGYSTIEPFLVFIPVMNEQGTGWVTDIEALPKTAPTPSPVPTPTPTPEPQDEFVTITVRKNWADASNAEGIRPQSITLYLYRKLSTVTTYPTDPYMTVSMTGTGNTWRFTFYDLPRRNESGTLFNYLVRERDVNGYEVDYQNNGTTITNVHNTPTPDPNNTPTPEPPITPEPSASPTPPPNVPTGVREIDGEWYYIDEYGTPLGLVPQTGDESDMLLYAGVALLMIAIACALLVALKRRRQMQQ